MFTLPLVPKYCLERLPQSETKKLTAIIPTNHIAACSIFAKKRCQKEVASLQWSSINFKQRSHLHNRCVRTITPQTIYVKQTSTMLPFDRLNPPPNTILCQEQQPPRMLSPSSETATFSIRENSLLKGTVTPTITNLSSSTRLRSNFLHKLGIAPNSNSSSCSKPPPATTSLSQSFSKTRYPQRSLLGNVKSTRVPLKQIQEQHRPKRSKFNQKRDSSDTVLQSLGALLLGPRHLGTPQSPIPTVCSSGGGETSTAEQFSATVDSRSSSGGVRHVHFDSNATVVLIPCRYEYSQRISQFLWNSPEVMRRRVVQNTLEMTADGWDWKGVLEEDEHYYNPLTQEYIHPVHLEIAHMPKEDQEAILPPGYINPALKILQ